MADKGIFTSEQEKLLAKLTDDALKPKSAFLELIDGYVAKVLITVLDDNLVDKLKAEVKEKIAAITDQIIVALSEEDPELRDAAILEAEDAVADLLNSLIDIPGLDEDSEGLIFKGAIELLAGVLLKWIEGKTA